jgi:hypothetical protein
MRIVAASERRTVNAVVQEYLAEVAGRDDRQAEARKQLLCLMETLKGCLPPDWKFDREESHVRVRYKNPVRSN